MKPGRWTTTLAAVGVAGLLAACTADSATTTLPASSGGSSTIAAVTTTATGSTADGRITSTTTPTTTVPPTAPTTTAASTGRLVIGALLPLTGRESAFGPGFTAAARVAVDDVNAAGGVFGAEVELIEADGGDSSLGLAPDAVAGMIEEGADVIVGALSSAVSESVIGDIVEAGVIQFSPSNTSPVFTDYPDSGLYFRTAASDALEGRILAQLLGNQGILPTMVIYRDDPYGQAVAAEFEATLTALGGGVVGSVPYDPDGGQVEVVSSIDPAAEVIVVVGLEETADIVVAMAAAGLGPAERSVWVLEPAFQDLGELVDDPAVLTGLRGLARGTRIENQAAPFAAMDTAWGAPIDIYTYGPETYDAVVITALAALAAGADDPVAIAAEINDVTRFGEICTNFADCAGLVASGTDIDYDGQGGTYRFSDLGEPTTAIYRVVTYTGAAEPDLGDIVQAL